LENSERNKRRERIQAMRDELTDNHSLGKIPPQSVDLESAVLGAILLEPHCLNTVASILRPESFYKTQHALVFKAIKELYDKGSPVDILTVTQQLRKLGDLEACGGPLYISQLTTPISSSANSEFHSRIICEKFILREIIRVGNTIIKKAYAEDTDTFELLDEFNSSINLIMMENIKQDAMPIRSLTGFLLLDVEKRHMENAYVPGTPTFIRTVDGILGGFKKTDLVLIAARPAMGKTSAMLSAALNQAKAGYKVAIFSLEMSRLQIMYRLASIETGIDLDLIMNKRMDDSRIMLLNQTISRLEQLPIWIDDTPALSVYDLRAKATRLKMQHGIDIVYVDYLQLCTLGKLSEKMVNNREREISKISAEMKRIAGELDIPVVALSQLSRAVEQRGGEKRPIMSDLRDSGSLEQDASVIVFLYRPEYYGVSEIYDGSPSAGLGEWIVAKNRNGKTNTAAVKWVAHLAKYTNRYEDELKTAVTNSANHADSRIESIKPNNTFIPTNNNNNDAPF
jgi:replicative DNA helicase